MSFTLVKEGEKPRAVAHRGYRLPGTEAHGNRYMEKYPENTELAFTQALRIGSHGLETGAINLSISYSNFMQMCICRKMELWLFVTTRY